MRPAQQLGHWVEQQIAFGRQGQRLPSQHRLAYTWRLSPTTVQRVMRPYVRAGLLTAVPGCGTHVGRPRDTMPEAAVAERGGSAQTIADALIGSIADGRLKRGHLLPRVKSLRLTYHVGPGTVTRAFREVARQGFARKLGKRY
jgi:DNA-binding transcriptional regulator YhcF (GntR family)